VLEVLNNMEAEPFPLSPETVTSLAALLDAAGMRAGGQYLAEAKAMHVQAGFEWSLQLDKQMASCKRATQRDKGPEVRAKEVKIGDISDNKWTESNDTPKEPKRVAWSCAWAVVWMLRAVQGAQLIIGDARVKEDEKLVKLRIESPKQIRRGWVHGGPSRVAVKYSVREIKAVGGWPFGPPSDPLFPSSSGHVVSKLHMLMPWANHLDKDMTGLDRTFSKEIRRHGLCKKGDGHIFHPGQVEIICSV
jgi:hypothetical protein